MLMDRMRELILDEPLVQELVAEFNAPALPSLPVPDENDNSVLAQLYRSIIASSESMVQSLQTDPLVGGLANTALDVIQRSFQFSAVLAMELYEAATAASDVFFETIDPSLEVHGHIQPVILGIPLGPPTDRVDIEVTKNHVLVDGEFGIITKLLTLAGIPESRRFGCQGFRRTHLRAIGNLNLNLAIAVGKHIDRARATATELDDGAMIG